MGNMPNPFTGAKHEARRSVAVWSPAARVVNGVPERGFAARVTFFGTDQKKGVKVDGDIVVYAFDEYLGRSAGNNAPDKTYPFLAEDLKQLQSHSKKLGYSYSLWVPWDNEGPEGERKTVSLMVKLVPKNGNSFLSGQAKCVLPGKEPSLIAKHSQQNGTISQVNYQFGRDDRFDDSLPPGFRDWTKQDISVITPEERQIRTADRPSQMVKSTIPIPNSTYSAIMQNNSPVVNPVYPMEMIALQNPPSPIMGVAYNTQPSQGQAPMPPQNYGPLYGVPQYGAPSTQNPGPPPTDVVPPYNLAGPTYMEKQGNATVSYFNGPRTTGSTGTNPLSLNR